MKHGKGIIEAAMRNNNIVILITVLLMVTGIYALIKMPRDEFPQFTIRQGVIIGVYPGATSAEVESQLTTVVENYIFGFAEVKKSDTYSQSKEGVMYIFVELNDNVKNADQFWSKLKHGLNELKSTLPSGVLALIANSDFGDTSAMLITLSSDSKSYKELEKELKKLEAECRKIPAASKIKHYGLQKEKIFINVKPELLNEYNIKTLTLLGSYLPNGMVNYAGNIKDGEYNLAIHLPSNFESEKDLGDQIVYSDPSGNVVRLRNIATIERKYEDPDNYIRQNGRITVLLSLEMQHGNNIVDFGKDVDRAIDDFKKISSDDVIVSKISELPKYVNDSVSDFMLEFAIAIISVILVTIILLPFRVASVAGVTVPIAVLITLGSMYFFGIELHTVSLASLILVLGMIVDNSIVVIDNHVEKLDQNISPFHAAIMSARELFVPITTATLAIMSAYIPLTFMVPGTAGEFMNSLPWVVSIALIVSIIVAVLLVPYLNFVFIKRGLSFKSRTTGRKTILDIVQKFFDNSLEKAFKYPKIVISAGVIAVFIAGVLFYTTEQQMFPELQRNQFAVEVTLPTGSAIEKTAEIVDSLERVLLNDERVTNVTSFIGTSSPRFHTVYAPNMPSPNYGQLLVNTISNNATHEIVRDYELKYLNAFPNAHVNWKKLIMQTSKAPIEIRISSDSIASIRKVQTQVLDIISKTPKVGWVRNDWEDPLQSIRVNVDRDKANMMGYSKSLVATSLMIGIGGLPLTTIWEDDYPVEVVLRREKPEVDNIKTITDQFINSPTSIDALPLRSFAELTPEWNEGTIVRRNGVKTLTILIDSERDAMASTIFNKIRPEIEKLNLSEGTFITYGGDYEGMKETFIPMTWALMLSILLIFIIILLQFKKMKLSLIIMITMLLVFPGAILGLKIMGYPFGITSFIGITSLCGMVVRNGIILIDYAQELKTKKGYSVREAAIAAGKRRMRPIFLTSAAASVGVLPMILSRSPLWGPVGTVIFFGLLVAMVLTLYILPVLYSVAIPDSPFMKHKLVKGSFNTLTVILIVCLFAFTGNKAKAQSLSLDSCKSLALANNKKIAQGMYEVSISEEVSKEAFTNYFPKVSAMALGMKSSDYLIKARTPELRFPVSDVNGMLTGGPQHAYIPSIPINLIDYMNTAAVTAALPVYAGGQVRNGNKLAKLGTEVNKLKLDMTTSEVLFRTEELYWMSISLKEKLKTLKSYEILLDTLNRDVATYLQAGLIQRTDLLKVQLKQNELLTNRFKLENGITLTMKALCQHIGIGYDSTLVLSDAPAAELLIVDPADINSAITKRNEYMLLGKAVEAEKMQAKMERGKLMPQVMVGAVAYYVDFNKTDDTNIMGFAGLNIPITDWWSGSHKLKEHKIKTDQAESKLQETTELMNLQANQDYNEMMENAKLIDLALKEQEQAEENLKVTRDNYNSGTTSVSDLLEAMALVQSANDNLTNAQCNYEVAKAAYLQSTGNYRLE
ncbi:MAG TPA: efflux RND transporter permease subunit [Bacteroidales bacterium]|nr:efflux RND transporter permease subunit [Bacteroidales bacterium]